MRNGYMKIPELKHYDRQTSPGVMPGYARSQADSDAFGQDVFRATGRLGVGLEALAQQVGAQKEDMRRLELAEEFSSFERQALEFENTYTQGNQGKNAINAYGDYGAFYQNGRQELLAKYANDAKAQQQINTWFNASDLAAAKRSLQFSNRQKERYEADIFKGVLEQSESVFADPSASADDKDLARVKLELFVNDKVRRQGLEPGPARAALENTIKGWEGQAAQKWVDEKLLHNPREGLRELNNYLGAGRVASGDDFSLAEIRESGGRVNIVNHNDGGHGPSFGPQQIATGNIAEFVQFAKGQNPSSGEAALLDKFLRADNAERIEMWENMDNAQVLARFSKDYIKATHYEPAFKMLPDDVKAAVDSDSLLRQVLMSTAIQHRNAAPRMFKQAWQEAGGDISKFYDELYDLRKNNFPSATDKDRAAVQRALDQELTLVHSMRQNRGAQGPNVLSGLDHKELLSARNKFNVEINRQEALQKEAAGLLMNELADHTLSIAVTGQGIPDYENKVRRLYDSGAISSEQMQSILNATNDATEMREVITAPTSFADKRQVVMSNNLVEYGKPGASEQAKRLQAKLRWVDEAEAKFKQDNAGYVQEAVLANFGQLKANIPEAEHPKTIVRLTEKAVAELNPDGVAGANLMPNAQANELRRQFARLQTTEDKSSFIKSIKDGFGEQYASRIMHQLNLGAGSTIASNLPVSPANRQLQELLILNDAKAEADFKVDDKVKTKIRDDLNNLMTGNESTLGVMRSLIVAFPTDSAMQSQYASIREAYYKLALTYAERGMDYSSALSKAIQDVDSNYTVINNDSIGYCVAPKTDNPEALMRGMRAVLAAGQGDAFSGYIFRNQGDEFVLASPIFFDRQYTVGQGNESKTLSFSAQELIALGMAGYTQRDVAAGLAGLYTEDDIASRQEAVMKLLRQKAAVES